jgi:acetyltransferase
MSTKNFEKLFNPKSIALIGECANEGDIAFSMFKNLRNCDFQGEIYVVNSRDEKGFGDNIYRSITDIDDNIDLAIIGESLDRVPSIIKEGAKKNMKGAIVVTANGEREESNNSNNSELEYQIISEARQSGIRVMGPECLSFVIPRLGINASPIPSLPPKGNLAFISQSGTICTAILDWAIKEKVGFSYVVSLGQMADVDFGDVINYLGDDNRVKSILLYLESLTNVKKFVGAARSVSRVKPIIALKAGKINLDSKYGRSYSATDTEDDLAYSTIFKRVGIVRVDTIEEIFNAASSLSKQPRPLKPNIAIITNSRSTSFMSIDTIIQRRDLQLAALSQNTILELNQVLPESLKKQNPIDLGVEAGASLYSKTLEVLLGADETGGVIVIFTPQVLTHASNVANAICDVAKRSSTKPIFAVWMGGKLVEDAINILHESGIPTYGTPEEAVKAFSHMYSYTSNLRLLQETPKLLNSSFDKRRAESVIRSYLEHKEIDTLSEIESKAIIASYEIPVNHTEIATTPLEASKASKEIGYPVLVKIHSPDVVHKSSDGGVAHDLRTEPEVIDSFKRIISTVKRLKADANILGVSVQRMIKDKGFECILGAKRHPTFGPLIYFGTGGIMAGYIDDIGMAIPPLNSTLALRLMEKTRIFDVLSRGFNNIPAAKIDNIVKVIVNFSELIADFPEIIEIEINPLYVRNDLILALDARIEIQRTNQGSAHHLLITPYPSSYESYHTLKDGTVVLLRPIKPEDEPLMLELFNTFSEKTIVSRFFHLINVTTHEQLIRFTQIDYDREISIIAVCQPPGRERILGIGQLIFDPKGEKAEFALVVGDPWQGRGLGTRLLDTCIAISQQRGVKDLWGEIIATNQPMGNLFKKMGFNIIKRDNSYYAELNLSAREKYG